MHIDFNSYFASVEQQANPFLRGKAIAVAGKSKHSIDLQMAPNGRFDLRKQSLRRTVITTASREAKRLGIKTAMASTDARRLVPDLIIVPGDPRKYSDITARFMNILERYADAVEQFSTDEAFADITISGGDYFGATILAQKIRQTILNECGDFCTVSIGIADNKFLAKLASESCKPSGITAVPPNDAIDFVDRQKLGDACGIGFQIEKHLNELGVSSFKTLRDLPLSFLVANFKSYGLILFQMARGLGDDQLLDSEEPPKSVGHSYTFPMDLYRTQDLQTQLLAMCDKIAWRLRKQELVTRRLNVYLRYGGEDGGGGGRQRLFREPLRDGLALAQAAWPILMQVWDERSPVRLLGVSASDLLSAAETPASLFVKNNRLQKATAALDSLQNKYGANIWRRAATLKTHFKERTSGWHYDHEL